MRIGESCTPGWMLHVYVFFYDVYFSAMIIHMTKFAQGPKRVQSFWSVCLVFIFINVAILQGQSQNFLCINQLFTKTTNWKGDRMYYLQKFKCYKHYNNEIVHTKLSLTICISGERPEMNKLERGLWDLASRQVWFKILTEFWIQVNLSTTDGRTVNDHNNK